VNRAFKHVDSLIPSFGQIAIYLFPLAFAINTERKQEKKKKRSRLFLAVYRCASSAIPEMKGDLASVPHFAVTTPIYTRTGGGTGDRETEMNENIEKRKKHNFVVSIISMASRWTIYERIADSSFIEPDDP